MNVVHKELGTFISGRVLLHDRQRGARGWLAERVTPTLFHLCWHFHVREACLGKKQGFMSSYIYIDVQDGAELSRVDSSQAGATHVQLAL